MEIVGDDNDDCDENFSEEEENILSTNCCKFELSSDFEYLFEVRNDN